MRSLLRLAILPITIIDAVLPKKGRIYEIGCGNGDLASYLANVRNRAVVGIDINAKKIANAQKRYRFTNIQFFTADALTFNYKYPSGIVLSDFLHHISYSDQKNLLAQLAKKISPNGTLVVKEIDKSEHVRASLSRIWDFILYPTDVISYRSKMNWQQLLENVGFSVQIMRVVRWFPGSTTLFICKKQ